MASFIAHGLVGAAATSLVNTAIGIKFKRLSWASHWTNVVVGFFLGSMNDTIDAVVQWIRKEPMYGPVYHWFHHEMPTWFGVIFWQSGLHKIMDEPFHKEPGWNWWPTMWPYEVIMWVLPILMIYALTVVVFMLYRRPEYGGNIE